MASELRDTTALTSRTFLPTDRDGNYAAHGRPAEIRLPDGLQASLVDHLAAPRSRSRLLVAVTIAGPVIAAAWAFFLGARFGRWA